MMNRMTHTCQFVKAMLIIRLPYEGQKAKIRERRPRDMVCGKPAEREVMFNSDMEPFWPCVEHYDLIIDGMPLWKSN
jgi:hypothetical protein